MKKYFLFPILALALLVVNAYFVSHRTYIRIWWLDNVLHIFGGFFVAMFFRSFISQKSFLGFLFFVIVVGGMWEFSEVLFRGPFFGIQNARLSNPIWVLDTLKDIFIDIVSALLWWYLASRYNKHNV